MGRSQPRARFKVVVHGSGAQNDMTQLSPVMGLVLGGIFAAAGLAIVFISLGWLPVDPNSVHAPMWVLGLAGLVFLLPGLLMCYYGLRNAATTGSAGELPPEKTWGGPSWFVAVMIVTAFAAIGLWIGFSEGPHEFSGGITGSQTEGRVVFGTGGFICALLAVWMWVRGLKEIFQPDE